MTQKKGFMPFIAGILLSLVGAFMIRFGNQWGITVVSAGLISLFLGIGLSILEAQGVEYD